MAEDLMHLHAQEPVASCSHRLKLQRNNVIGPENLTGCSDNICLNIADVFHSQKEL